MSKSKNYYFLCFDSNNSVALNYTQERIRANFFSRFVNWRRKKISIKKSRSISLLAIPISAKSLWAVEKGWPVSKLIPMRKKNPLWKPPKNSNFAFSSHERKKKCKLLFSHLEYHRPSPLPSSDNKMNSMYDYIVLTDRYNKFCVYRESEAAISWYIRGRANEDAFRFAPSGDIYSYFQRR